MAAACALWRLLWPLRHARLSFLRRANNQANRIGHTTTPATRQAAVRPLPVSTAPMNTPRNGPTSKPRTTPTIPNQRRRLLDPAGRLGGDTGPGPQPGGGCCPPCPCGGCGPQPPVGGPGGGGPCPCPCGRGFQPSGGPAGGWLDMAASPVSLLSLWLKRPGPPYVTHVPLTRKATGGLRCLMSRLRHLAWSVVTQRVLPSILRGLS